MGDARIEASHHREVLNTPLISFKGFNGRKIGYYDEGPGNPFGLVVKHCRGQNHG